MNVRFAVSALAGMLSAGAAFAQQGSIMEAPSPAEVAPASVEDTYGSAQTAVVMTMFDCAVFSQADVWFPVLGTPNRYMTTSAGAFLCPVHAPSGSQITRIEIEGCDSSAAAEVHGTLARTTTPGGVGLAVADVGTGVAATPGCGFFGFDLTTPHTIDNSKKYWVQVTMGNSDTTTIAAVRAYYRLQVSAAPATATFPNDVPTSHPFFRFVEALARAGITGGCGPGAYCPDSPITRGQMAVFLAAALGLHFSP